MLRVFWRTLCRNGHLDVYINLALARRNNAERVLFSRLIGPLIGQHGQGIDSLVFTHYMGNNQ